MFFPILRFNDSSSVFFGLRSMELCSVAMPSSHRRRLEQMNQRDADGRISNASQGLIFVFVFLLHQWRIFFNLRSIHPSSYMANYSFVFCIDQQDKQDDDDDMRQHRIRSPP